MPRLMRDEADRADGGDGADGGHSGEAALTPLGRARGRSGPGPVRHRCRHRGRRGGGGAVLGVNLVHANDQVTPAADIGRAPAPPAAVVAALETPGHKVVNMEGANHVSGGPIRGRPDGRGYLVTSDLPALSADHTYQLWGVINGQTISLGLMGQRPNQATFTLAGSPRCRGWHHRRAGPVGQWLPSRPMVAQGRSERNPSVRFASHARGCCTHRTPPHRNTGRRPSRSSSGSMLLTLVEPRRGHEVAYNRWYERDHFYAGCMVGPYNFAGRRFVATAELKALRDPDPSAITGEPARGSYVAVYWVLDGYYDVWQRWALRQVNALHAAGRMFEERDHVHTLLYNFRWEHRRDPDGVPVELALDHPYRGSSPSSSTAPRTSPTRSCGSGSAPSTCPVSCPAPTPTSWRPSRPSPWRATLPATCRAKRPVTLAPSCCGSSTRPPRWRGSRSSPNTAAVSRTSGMGTVVAALPFIPTIPGTDTYTDQLWGD